MNKSLPFIALLLISSAALAQTSLPNGNFENWNSRSFAGPANYNSSNQESIQDNLPFGCIRSTDAFHGNSALQLLTVSGGSDTAYGYIVNGNPEDDPQNWHGGIPCSVKPSGIRGYYKCDIKTGDTAWIIVAFSKNGVNIGTYFYPFYGQKNSYTLFQHNFAPALSQTPDSMIFAAVSSDVLHEMAVSGSTITLDSISLTGTPTQPADLNGDFESWNTYTQETPTGWYVNDSRELQQYRSNEAYQGLSAIKLVSILRTDGGQQRTNGSRVGTGYYPRNCNNCQEMGGYPFNRNTDTLMFWYKYAPAGNGKAQMYVGLKKNGSNIWGNGMELSASAAYQYAEMPISAGQTPDTLLVNFESSRWEDSAVIHAGSILIVDEVQLKSEPLRTGLNTPRSFRSISLYPNPASEILSIHIHLQNAVALRITDLQGREMKTLKINGQNLQISVVDLPEGLYLAEITDRNGSVYTQRFSIRH